MKHVDVLVVVAVFWLHRSTQFTSDIDEHLPISERGIQDPGSIEKMVLTGIRLWFRFPERQPLFLIGLIYSSSLARFVLQVLVTFLTGIWKLKLKHAVAIMNIQGGLALVMEMVMTLLVDAGIGRYWMFFFTSALYCIGLGLLSRSLPQFISKGVGSCSAGDKICASKLKASPFFWAMSLIILAKAGQGICFEALTFYKMRYIRLHREGRTRRVPLACFNFTIVRGERRHKKWLLRIICIIAAIAGTLTGIFELSSSAPNWSSRFKTSAYAMGIGTFIFLLGYPFHPPVERRRSPLASMLRVLLAAILKRRLDDPQQGIELNNPRRALTPHLRCLNKAVNDMPPNYSCFPDRWVSCDVEQVEVTKQLLNMVPISATFLLYGMIKANCDTFFIEQAKAMDRTIRDIKFPIQIFLISAELTRFIIKHMYKWCFEKRVQQSNGNYSDRMKIGFGLLVGLATCGAASSVEGKRLKALSEHGLLNDPKAIAPLSVFLLTPQFILMGIMDGLACDGMRDFFKHQFPASMKRYGVLFTDVMIGLGKILNTVFILVLDMVVVKLNGKGEDGSWFANNVNGGHLDYFYQALVVLSLLNAFCYAFVAHYYPNPDVPAEDEGEGEELQEENANEEEIAAYMQAFFPPVEDEMGEDNAVTRERTLAIVNIARNDDVQRLPVHPGVPSAS